MLLRLPLPAFAVLMVFSSPAPASGAERIFDVKNFGAVGNGIADDTPAVRQALRDASRKRHSVVFFPAGTYRLAPAGEGQPAFEIRRSGIELRGEGADRTVLSFAASGGLDPAAAILRRGGAFLVHGRGKVRDVVFRGLRITGNTLPNEHAGEWHGDAARRGWDITHKAITITGNVSRVVIEDCVLDGGRGEVIYAGGGRELGRFEIKNSRIFHSNASAISMTGDVLIENCEIFDVYNAVENFSIAPHHKTVVRNSRIEPGRSLQSAKFGIVFIGTRAASLVVENCRIRRAHQAGIFLSESAHNVLIQNNEITDSPGIYAITLNLYNDFAPERGYSSLRIEGNRFHAHGRSVNAPAIRFYTDHLSGMTIRGNHVLQSGSSRYARFLDLPASATAVKIQSNRLPPGVTPE